MWHLVIERRQCLKVYLCTGLIEVLSILHVELKWLCIYTVFGHRTLNSSAMKCIMDRLMVSMSMTRYEPCLAWHINKLCEVGLKFHGIIALLVHQRINCNFCTPTFTFLNQVIGIYFIFCFCIYWPFRLCQSSTSIKSHYLSHLVCIDSKRSCFKNTWFWSKTILLYSTL